MQKTILMSVSLVCVTTVISVFLIANNKQDIISAEYAQKDKFTNCVQVIMSESRHSGKVIDAEKASDLCKNVNLKD